MAQNKWMPLPGEDVSTYFQRISPYVFSLAGDLGVPPYGSPGQGVFGTAVDDMTLPGFPSYQPISAIDGWNNVIRPWIIALWAWRDNYLITVQGINIQEWWDNQDFPLSDVGTL